MKPEVAHRRIESFAKRFGEAHLMFAYHAAFPLALTPVLLYKLWANFQRDIHGRVLGIPWVAVADLLLSSLCEEVGHELYEMDAAMRNLLLSRLKEDINFGQQRINELSDFLLAYVRQQLNSSDPDVRDFAEAQRWTALAYVRPNETARELVLALKNGYKQDTVDVVRIASLVETLSEPLAEFESLLVYSSGLAYLVRGDLKNAIQRFSQISKPKSQIQIAGVMVSIPKPVLQSILSSRNITYFQSKIHYLGRIITSVKDNVVTFIDRLSILKRYWKQTLNPLLFGLLGAAGCLLGSVMGEVWLTATQIETQSVELGFVSSIIGNFSIYSLLRISGWTAMLALGSGLFLIVGQNIYLRRRFLTRRESINGIIGSLLVGFGSGIVGQLFFSLFFSPIASFSILLITGRIASWAIVGTLLGSGMSFVVPNLRLSRALQGGSIGGGIGAIGFLVAGGMFGDIAGRLVGAIILGFFIGLMIALLEVLSREAYLIVHWTPTEQTKIILGARPVVLGSSNEAHIYLRKDQGYPPVTAKIFTEEGKIVMQFDPEIQKTKPINILRHELSNGDRRKIGALTIEVRTSK